jgi:hypothetical protein
MGKINLTESEKQRILSLHSNFTDVPTRRLNEDNWMQKVDKDIEKRGTEGVFHKFCVDNGFEDGCSKGCWDKAKEKGGVWGRRAGLAKAYCESKR